VLFGGGLGMLFFNLKRRRKLAATPLSESEHAAAAHLLGGDSEGQK
jgi:hypothetical protein